VKIFIITVTSYDVLKQYYRTANYMHYVGKW